MEGKLQQTRKQVFFLLYFPMASVLSITPDAGMILFIIELDHENLAICSELYIQQ